MKFRKIEFVLLAVVILTLVLYLVLRSGGDPARGLPQPAASDSGGIDRLVVAKGNEPPMTLEKRGERWFVGPRAYPADRAAVNNMVKAAADLTLTALVSESRSYERYGLTPEERITVQAFQGDARVRDFVIGKPAPTQQHTFVLLADDPNVYHARGQIVRTFDRTVASLRDRTVFDFDRDRVHTIALSRADATSVLQLQPVDDGTTSEDRNDPGVGGGPPVHKAWQDAQGRTVDQEAVTRLLEGMARLQCDSYLDDAAVERLVAPRWQITFESPDGNFTLMVFASDAEPQLSEDKVPAMASTNDYAFALDATRVEQYETALDALLAGDQ
ncbi:DUF4340 domain-containing protein [Desulfatitalea alkaliphila]|uniref:DUF4340 domain-containing protein n=1 Tax=Desulfatitalea alkaliphila TaxID=2929485 RepID=A0AA41R1J7_9BACT|nr:DUF4340 domain-containing protein [Desulfatitalea alkaliphila]MCJ8501212.1 DUF4340 domain-containing protein [Desulfatitalea alkaliphila]